MELCPDIFTDRIKKIVCKIEACERVRRQKVTRKRAIRDCIPSPGLLLCGVCVLVCYVINKRHNWNCHFITAGSDGQVPRRPALIHPRFDRTLDPDPWRLLLPGTREAKCSIGIRLRTCGVRACVSAFLKIHFLATVGPIDTKNFTIGVPPPV